MKEPNHDVTDAMTLREARRRYFERNGFGHDGGYGDRWVDFSLGPIPFPFPNTAARVRAVRYHDLHHVLTGYPTTTCGEFQISAWEIAAGCKGFGAAWALNLGGTFAGAVVAPRQVFAAFVRGRRDRTLYGEPLDPLLEGTVGGAKARFLSPSLARPTVGDALWFALAVALGFVVAFLLFAALLPLVPVGVVTNALRQRSKLNQT